MHLRSLFSMLILSLLLSGCQSPSDKPAPHGAHPSKSLPDLVLKGVIVTRSTEHTLSYQKKCESCGFITPQTFGTAIKSAPWACQITLTCPKCGHTTEGFIKKLR